MRVAATFLLLSSALGAFGKVATASRVSRVVVTFPVSRYWMCRGSTAAAKSSTFSLRALLANRKTNQCLWKTLFHIGEK